MKPKMICDDCFHKDVCRLDGNEILEWCSAMMPSADVVKVKHGEWINPEMGYEVCSVCGYCFAVYDEHDYQIERNFCPKCGADMRGETNENNMAT